MPVRLIGYYHGMPVTSVEPDPDLEAELRRELSVDNDIFSDANTRKVAIAFEKSVRALMMNAPVRGVTVTGLDLSDPLIGSSSRSVQR